MANDKKLTVIYHQRECIDLRDKVSKLESEVTSSSNRVKLAEEKLNVAKSLTTLVQERNKEVEANEKLKEVSYLRSLYMVYSENFFSYVHIYSLLADTNEPMRANTIPRKA